MTISIIWQLVPESKHDQRAVALAGAIAQEVRLSLRPGIVYRLGENWEALILEVPGLAYKLPKEDTFEPFVFSKVATIEYKLRKYDIVPYILINNCSLLTYAMEQESLAQTRQAIMNGAIARLRATRGWFKDHRLADIRRELEQKTEQ